MDWRIQTSCNKDREKMSSTLKDIWKFRHNIVSLIRYDFSQNYFKSYLGVAWAILAPLINLAVLSAVFMVGFRVPPITDSGAPFAAWLACGMVCWQFFSEGLSCGVSSITSYAFLVRKAQFRISFLPPIRICSAFIIHCALLVFLFCLLLFLGIYPTLYWLQWFYYTTLLLLLLIGLAFVTSSVSIFLPDITNVVGVFITVGFWATPVFWNANMVSERWRWIFDLNPVYYCVKGFRDAFLSQRWFWERPILEHVFFGAWLILFVAAGVLLFKKLRPYFGDEL